MTSFLIREALICSVGLVFSNFLTSCSGSWSGDIVNKSIYSVCFKHQPYPESPGPVYSLFCLLSKTHSCKRKRESALDQSRKEGKSKKDEGRPKKSWEMREVKKNSDIYLRWCIPVRQDSLSINSQQSTFQKVSFEMFSDPEKSLIWQLVSSSC